MHCIEKDLPVEGLCSAKVSRDAQEILEAGLKSADSGQTIMLAGASK
jgi:predicted dehydrogenase